MQAEAHDKLTMATKASQHHQQQQAATRTNSKMGFPSCFEAGNSSNGCDVKSSSTARTGRTCVESSEEFTLSAELSTAAEDEPMLQLSGISMVHSNAGSKQQQQLLLLSQSSSADLTHDRKVQFANDVTYIEEKDIVVTAAKSGKKKNKKKQQEEEKEEEQAVEEKSAAEVLPEEIWWSPAELASIESNALYMVKECQQYQEEVVCTVLYNKAFLTAANLAKTITEEELEDRLKDISQQAQSLESWTAVGQCRRGLESFVSEKAGVNAVESRKAVLQFQRELREGKVDNDDSATLTAPAAPQQQHAELLAAKCQDSSRTARIMARMMGQADRDSLTKAEDLCQEIVSLPNPPGVYDCYNYQADDTGSSGRRQSRRQSRRSSISGSLLKPIKKVFNVLRRQDSEEIQRRRIVRIQQKNMLKAEPQSRQSEEFRRSFLDILEYGEQ